MTWTPDGRAWSRGSVAFTGIDEVNRQFVFITPFVTPFVVALPVVTIFAQRLGPPAAEGISYFKDQL